MRISVNYGVTANLGDYWSVKPEVRIDDEVRNGEMPEDTHRRLLAVARKLFLTSLRSMVTDAEDMQKDLGTVIAAGLAGAGPGEARAGKPTTPGPKKPPPPGPRQK